MSTGELASKNISFLIEALPAQSRNIQKDIDITQLWKDNNPLVSWLSRLRSPLQFDAQLFIPRVEQEGGMPRGTDGETVIRAIFAATKQELSSDHEVPRGARSHSRSRTILTR